jgi:hypothetical protein
MIWLVIAICFGFAVGGMFRNSRYDGSLIRPIGRTMRSPVTWIALFVIISMLVHAYQ